VIDHNLSFANNFKFRSKNVGTPKTKEVYANMAAEKAYSFIRYVLNGRDTRYYLSRGSPGV
jgi:hypothetical protein